MIPKELNCAGIYAIRHVADGKVYVGQSQNIARRIRYHRDYDRDCTHLYRAIDLYGWDAFEVEVLEEVDDHAILNEREQYWMDTLEAYNPNKGYNILRWADGKATRTKKDKQTYDILIRFPDEVQAPLTTAAQAEDRSINWLVVAAVRRYLADLAPAPADTQSAHSTSGAFVLPAAPDGRADHRASVG